MRNTVEFLSRTFPNDKLRGVTLALDTALNGRSLDVDTAEVELTTGPAHLGFWTHEPLPFFTRDRKCFLTSEQTALGAWSRSDALTMRRGGSQYAIMLPSEVTRVGKRNYTVSCTSALGRLVQLPHRGGIYTGSGGSNPMTAGRLIREICGYVNGSPAAGVTVYVAPEFEGIAIYGWLPYLSPTGENGAETGSARDNLLQVLFAINACLRDDATGTLRVENLSTEPASTITADRVYREGAQVVEEQPVTAVTVLEHQYIPAADTEVLYEGTTVAGQVVVFSGPMSGLVADGFTIMESGANYAVLSAGTGTLKGTPYLDNTIEVTRAVTAGAEPNTERVEQATLVSLTNSGDVSDRLAAYYAHRKWIECDAQIEFEDPGDVVSIWDPFDEVQRSACIESISPLVVSGVMRGRVSALIGYTPWQTVPFEDRRVLLTGSGRWTVPAGVTEIIAVLIGGGSGGTKGTNGAQGTANQVVTTMQNGTQSAAAGKGGAGGKGGPGGAPGKVIRIRLSVTAGQSFSYACGARGVGGANPTSGTETSFGAYSSATGSIAESGYTDPVTGKVYAIPGTDGVDGGNGGDGGSVSASSANDGKAGGGAGLYSGGAGGLGYYAEQLWENIKWRDSQGGAGGGGASGEQNGQDGGTSTRSQDAIGDNAGDGGNGASATTAIWTDQDYGCGGNGGNGGGGGGGAGGLYYYQNNSPGYIVTVSISFRPTPGAGGIGGAGGNGVAGCVILYYRVPVSGGA